MNRKQAPGRPRRRTPNRIALGEYGETVLGILFSQGGGTALQLAEWLVRETPELAESDARSEAKARPRHVQAAYRTLSYLRKSRLVESVPVRREHVTGTGADVAARQAGPRPGHLLDGGDPRLGHCADVRRSESGARSRGRGGRREELFYLVGKGVGMGAEAVGARDARGGRADYARCHLPRDREHAALRADFYLSLVRDSETYPDVRVPVEKLRAESYRRFPLFGSPVTTDVAGEELPERSYARARYASIEPDGAFEVWWGHEQGSDGVLKGAFYLEVEAGEKQRTRAVAEKIDDYAGHLLRLYRRSERRELERWKACREVMDDQIKRFLTADRNAPGKLVDERVRLAEFISGVGDGPVPYFLGLPETFRPVVFLFRSHALAWSVRSIIAEGRYPTPKLDEARGHLAGVLRGERLLRHRREAEEAEAGGYGSPAEPSEAELEAAASDLDLGRFFVFGGWSSVADGTSLGPVYAPLDAYPGGEGAVEEAALGRVAAEREYWSGRSEEVPA